MNITHYDLFYTVIKNRDDRVIVDDQFENNENDYFFMKIFLYLINISGLNLVIQ